MTTRTFAHKRQFNVDNPFGTALSRKLKQNRSDYGKRISIPGGGNGTMTFVLGAQLLEIIQPALDDIVETEKETNLNNQQNANGTMTFARQACLYSELRNAEAIVRRLYALRDGRERTTDFSIADQLCLAANNPYGMQRVHVLPRHWRGAIEVASAWAFARDLKINSTQLEEIAAETLEVARALWHRPHRQVVCTPKAFEAIGGEHSRWLTTAGPK